MAKRRRRRRAKHQPKQHYDAGRNAKDAPPPKGERIAVECPLAKNSSTLTLACRKQDAGVQTRASACQQEWPQKPPFANALMATIRFRRYDVAAGPANPPPPVSMTTKSHANVTSRESASRASFRLEFVDLNASSNNSIAQRDERIRSECSLKRLFQRSQDNADSQTNHSTLILGSTTSVLGKPHQTKYARRHFGVARSRIVKTTTCTAARGERRPKRSETHVPKSFTPRKRSLQKSPNAFNMSQCHLSACSLRVKATDGWGIVQGVRKIHEKFARRMMQRFVAICAWFGLDFKEGNLRLKALSRLSVDAHNVGAGGQQPEQAPTDDRPEKGTEQLRQLQDEIVLLREELIECKICAREARTMCAKEMHELRAELNEMKEWIKVLLIAPNGCRKSSENLGGPSPPPPPPPMPPNLPCAPPPPPPMPQFNNPAKPLKIEKSHARQGKSENTAGSNNARPVISVDAIRNVKLKKPGDRRRSPAKSPSQPQPMVSMDMLRQVKLKPASRNQPGSCGTASLLQNGCLGTSDSSLARENAASRLGA